jgi:hypothetical protein
MNSDCCNAPADGDTSDSGHPEYRIGTCSKCHDFALFGVTCPPEAEPPPSRFGVAVLIGVGLTLALAGGVLAMTGHHPAAIACAGISLACGIRAFRSPV